MSTEKIWWHARGDHKTGPHTAAELKALVAGGQIIASDMIWKDGMPNWLPASSVNGLIPTGVGAAPPPLPGSATQPPPLSRTTPPMMGNTPAAPRKMSVVTKVFLWIGGVFMGLIVLAAIFGSDSKKPDSPSSTSEAAVTATAAIKVGETFSTPTFEIQVRSAQLRSSVGDSLFASTASEGAAYVAILWTYKNISTKPVSSFRQPRIKLKAPDGTEYDHDIGASSSFSTEHDLDSKVLSDLNPGIRVTDADVFEVSRELFNPATWKILIDADDDQEIEFLVAERKAAASTPGGTSTETPPPPQSQPEKPAVAAAQPQPVIAAIPPIFQGKWADATDVCEAKDMRAEEATQIEAETISGYEYFCNLKQVTASNGQTFTGLFACSQEGEEYEQVMRLALRGDGKLSLGDSSPLLKCA